VTLIREYNPATDAAGLAAHFVRSGYGPHHGLSKLGAESMAAVLTERAPELFMVAVDDDDIIGCIGFMRGSGRRVTRDGELFAGLFVLDPRHRNSMLAGNLFVKSFEKLVAGGTRAMRIEANPTNKKAFPLYLRVGFRARPDARADEDGYVELVSHLPGVIGDLLRSNAGDELIDVLPKFSWRNAGAGRDATPTSGVSIQADGAAVVSYDLSAGDFKLRADINMDSGATLGYDVVAGTIQELQLHEGLDRHEPAEVAAVRDLGQGITAEVDALGSVRIYGPGGPGPALVDHWPVVRGETPSGWRRPGVPKVHIEARGDAWHMMATGETGTITREIRFAAGQLSVTSVLATDVEDRELVASPWVSLRKAEKYVATGGNEWLGGPAVRGIWPDDYTDFEACADDVLDMPQGMRSVWRNASLTIEAEWPADMAVRHEGSHLPQLRRPGNIPLTYNVKVSAAPGGEPPQEFSTPRGITVEKVRRVHRVRATVSETSRPAPWQALKRQGKDVVESLHADMALRYSEAAAGIVGWFHEGKDVLSSPYPGTRSWGSLTDWSAGLWAARCRPREDPEQGVEWVGRTSALQLNEFARGEDRDGWTVDVVNGRIPALELAAKLSPTPQHSDMAFYLTPAASPGAPVLFGERDTEKWVVEATDRSWSAGTSRIAVELQNGGYLVVRPVSGHQQEIFIRSERKGVHLSLLSRLQEDRSECRWRLSVVPHRSAALVEMDR
jgi:ribosomal protein S18 acetylase RimI-like enzyme